MQAPFQNDYYSRGWKRIGNARTHNLTMFLFIYIYLLLKIRNKKSMENCTRGSSTPRGLRGWRWFIPWGEKDEWAGGRAGPRANNLCRLLERDTLDHTSARTDTEMCTLGNPQLLGVIMTFGLGTWALRVLLSYGGMQMGLNLFHSESGTSLLRRCMWRKTTPTYSHCDDSQRSGEE